MSQNSTAAPRSYIDVSDSEALAEALDELDDAREDLEAMRRDTAARRRLGSLWLSFVEPLVEAVEVAEERVEELRASQGPEPLGADGGRVPLARPRGARRGASAR